MWLFTTEGFYSGVAERDARRQPIPGRIQVRARKHSHLVALRERVPSASAIQTGGGTDYPYRVYMTTEEWVAFCAGHAEETDRYTNFKDAVRSASDHNVYSRVWGVLRDLTPRNARRSRRRPDRDPSPDMTFPWVD